MYNYTEFDQEKGEEGKLTKIKQFFSTELGWLKFWLIITCICSGISIIYVSIKKPENELAVKTVGNIVINSISMAIAAGKNPLVIYDLYCLYKTPNRDAWLERRYPYYRTCKSKLLWVLLGLQMGFIGQYSISIFIMSHEVGGNLLKNKVFVILLIFQITISITTGIVAAVFQKRHKKGYIASDANIRVQKLKRKL